MELKQQAVLSAEHLKQVQGLEDEHHDLKVQLKALMVSRVFRKILDATIKFSHRGMYNVFACIYCICIQTTLEEFQKVLTDEKESRKSLDASIQALTVSLCIATDCNFHII